MRCLIIVLLSSMLSGCFGFSFWFERLDTLALWRLGTMFDLSDEQEDMVQPVLVELREALRQDTLPDIIQRLESVDRLWQQDQMEDALVSLEMGTEAVIARFLEYSWPKVAPLLAHLTAENAQAYMDYGEEKIEDWFDQTLSDEAKREDRIERLEDWFGDLSDGQIAVITEHTYLLPGERDIRVQNSRQRRHRFMSLVLDNEMDTLEILYKYPHHAQTPEYQLWRTEERAQIHRCLMTLFPTLTVKQRQHASRYLRDWIDELRNVKPALT